LEHGELMPEGENLRPELKTGPNGSPERDEEGDEQRRHAGRERYQPPAQICNDDSTFWISGQTRSEGIRVIA
jgi:hypothetical protein